MEPQIFQKTLDDIITLNETEGPRQNLFEPKFKAREQAQQLLTALKNAYKDALPLTAFPEPESAAEKSKQDDSIALLLRTQWQIARTLVFLGNNAHELEDDKDAQDTLLRAAAIAIDSSNQSLVFASQKDFKPELVPPMSLPLLLKKHSAEMAGPKHNFYGVQWLLDVLNSLGVFFSARMEARERVGDAICVLHKIEEIFHSFNKWARANGDTTSLETLPWKSDDGSEIDLSRVELPKEVQEQLAGKENEEEQNSKELDKLKGQMLRRMHLEQRYTSTLFYLAQGYGLHSDQVNASKYCFLTMVHQLLCRKDFSKREWASNAVHLSSFFNAEGQFAYAKHCLDAARLLMPTEDPSEETLGTVAWGFAKHYKAVLRTAAAHKEHKDGTEDPEFREYLGPKPDSTNTHIWWRDFPLAIPPPQKDYVLPSTFEAARDVFKLGKDECDLAQKYFTYDTCCPDYIKIFVDVSELYRCLAVFEPAMDRKVAMHVRRVEMLERFPKELNFDSYTQLVRQTLFDVGDIMSDVVDMRHQQRTDWVAECHAAAKNGQPRKKAPYGTSDTALAQTVKKAQQFYVDFVNTYKDKITKQFPNKIEKEALPAMLRAKIRIARLEGKFPCATPQEEYEMVKRMQGLYKETAQWAEEQEVVRKEPSLAQEARLANEMVPVLDGKLRDIYRTYSKMTQ